MINKKHQFNGCLLGGAIGDALGYPVEFLKLDAIKMKFGEEGITDLVVDLNSHYALVSDDTQMTLFTADGMIWAYLRCSQRGIGSYAGSGVYQSYLRWYYTQRKEKLSSLFLQKQPHETEGYIVKYSKTIMEYPELFKRRAPGVTCLSALESGKYGTLNDHINNSKGCGGVMRVAPVGLFLNYNKKESFHVAAEVAALTHGHPSGYLSAGVLAAIISGVINDEPIRKAVDDALEILVNYEGHEETLLIVKQAMSLVQSTVSPINAIQQLGEGWVAEEALAIALYCALKESEVERALILAVNHDGDSDSTGAICGNILGAIGGIDALPASWVNKVELKPLIIDLSDKLHDLSVHAFSK